MSKIYGYVMASSIDQNEDRRIIAIKRSFRFQHCQYHLGTII